MSKIKIVRNMIEKSDNLFSNMEGNPLSTSIVNIEGAYNILKLDPFFEGNAEKELLDILDITLQYHKSHQEQLAKLGENFSLFLTDLDGVANREWFRTLTEKVKL